METPLTKFDVLMELVKTCGILGSAIISLLTLLLARRLRSDVTETGKAINGRMDQLLRKTEEVAHLSGEKEGVAKEQKRLTGLDK